MSTKPIVAIDIDDVLADHARQFVAFSNKRWGTDLTIDDYDEHWAKMWQIDAEENSRRAKEFRLSGIVSQYNPDDLALDVLMHLSKTTRLIVLTSRRLEMENETVTWINSHYPNIFSGIYFSGIWDNGGTGNHLRTKADVCVSLGVNYLIDDQLKHCVAAAAYNIEGLLFGDYTWNKAGTLPEKVTRVKDWMAVKDYFNEAQLWT